jgi:rod shape-determining protein MreD
MKDFIEVFVGLLLAFLFYTVFKRISHSLIQLFNIFSLIVIYFALEKGESFGACLGTVCGLIQDAFSLGVFGVAGLSKTIMGFLAGYISRKLDVSPFFRKLIFIFVLLSLEFVLWTFLSLFIYSERLLIGRTLQSFQPLATAVLGSVLFFLLGQIKKYSSLHST